MDDRKNPGEIAWELFNHYVPATYADLRTKIPSDLATKVEALAARIPTSILHLRVTNYISGKRIIWTPFSAPNLAMTGHRTLEDSITLLLCNGHAHLARDLRRRFNKLAATAKDFRKEIQKEIDHEDAMRIELAGNESEWEDECYKAGQNAEYDTHYTDEEGGIVSSPFHELAVDRELHIYEKGRDIIKTAADLAIHIRQMWAHIGLQEPTWDAPSVELNQKTTASAKGTKPGAAPELFQVAELCAACGITTGGISKVKRIFEQHGVTAALKQENRQGYMVQLDQLPKSIRRALQTIVRNRQETAESRRQKALTRLSSRPNLN